ncbi:hypothetical protein [Rhodococcus marinonascens]|uniref:hypothetical protein n=1 Tax=Rhodococcus marinonascens TaxID=38311 RepID=UPI000932D589|nr:hypothetical protein [Rhodococcus marinonascens]
MEDSAATVRRATVSLRERDERNLEKVADMAGLNKNDAIRKSLATEAFFLDVRKEGSDVYVKGKDGVFREIKFVD